MKQVFQSDRIEVKRHGERITVWNHVTVTQRHYVRAESVESEHEIAAGDHPSGSPPDYVTPHLDDQLCSIGVYPNYEVVDPTDEDISIL